MPAARWRPTRSAATSGTIFRRQSYKSLPSVGTVTVYDPFTGEAAAIQDAGRRARLYPRPVADQPVVDGPIPVEQHASANSTRARRSQARMDSFQDSIDQNAVAGKARQGYGARRQGSGGHRSHNGDELAAHPGRLSARLRQGRRSRCSVWRSRLFDREGASRSARSRPARRSICWPISIRCRNRRLGPSAWATTKQVVAALVKLVHDLRALPKGATDEQAREVFANLGEQIICAEQMPGLRRQSRALFRHQA